MRAARGMETYRVPDVAPSEYGCETWSLTSVHEQTPRVNQSTVSSKAFGPQTEEVTWEWRKLCEEKLRELYCRANMVRGLVAHMGDTGGACRVWWGNLRERERERACGTYGRHWRCIQGWWGNLRERQRERENVALMGDMEGACRVGGET